MIDFVKIHLKKADVSRLLTLPCLNFKGEFSHTTGEISSKAEADYHFCKITINKAGVFFSGSIHKLWNSLHGTDAPNKIEGKYKGFNGSLFTYSAIDEVRTHLADLFDCEPFQMIFQNMEYGLNTTPKFNPKRYLDGLLIHKGKEFESIAGGNYKQVTHQQYYLKIYNKSKQYGMCEHTLRVELKIYKARILHRLGIRTFADVTPETLKNCNDLLLEVFNQSLHYDYTIRENELTERQIAMLWKYKSVSFWLNDLPKSRHDAPKKRLVEITAKHSDKLHEKVVREIDEKFKVSSVTINRLSEAKKSISNITINRVKKTPRV